MPSGKPHGIDPVRMTSKGYLGSTCSFEWGGLSAQDRGLLGIMSSETGLEAELLQVLSCKEGLFMRLLNSFGVELPGPGKEWAGVQLREVESSFPCCRLEF